MANSSPMTRKIGSFPGVKRPQYDPRFDPSAPQNTPGAGMSAQPDDEEDDHKNWFSKLKQLLGYTTPADKGMGA